MCTCMCRCMCMCACMAKYVVCIATRLACVHGARVAVLREHGTAHDAREEAQGEAAEAAVPRRNAAAPDRIGLRRLGTMLAAADRTRLLRLIRYGCMGGLHRAAGYQQGGAPQHRSFFFFLAALSAFCSVRVACCASRAAASSRSAAALSCIGVFFRPPPAAGATAANATAAGATAANGFAAAAGVTAADGPPPDVSADGPPPLSKSADLAVGLLPAVAAACLTHGCTRAC